MICFSIATPLYKTLHLDISDLSNKNEELCFGYIDNHVVSIIHSNLQTHCDSCKLDSDSEIKTLSLA